MTRDDATCAVRPHLRRGTALVAVLVALVVATLAATAVAALARMLQAHARGAAAVLRARTSAEGAIATVLASRPTAWAVLPPGGSDARTVSSSAGTATVRALRLDARRYLLTADAASAAVAGPVGPAVRRVGVFAQLDVAYDGPAALVVAGPVTLALDTELRAADAAPATWTDCGAPADVMPVAAVAAPSLQLATDTRVLGPVLTATSAWSPPAPERFGDIDRAALTARADVVLSAGGLVTPLPRAASGTEPACVRDRTSWGDPWRGSTAVAACTGDYPVVHLRGTGLTTIRGPARFQGTLLVDGSLNVIGRVDVAGLVVVGGALQASSGVLVVDGMVLVRGSAASLGSGSRVRRSRCALDRAAAAASRAVPLARRAWVDVVR